MCGGVRWGLFKCCVEICSQKAGHAWVIGCCGLCLWVCMRGWSIEEHWSALQRKLERLQGRVENQSDLMVSDIVYIIWWSSGRQGNLGYIGSLDILGL